MRDLVLFLPETLLGVTVLVLFCGDLLLDSETAKKRVLAPLAIIGLIAAGIAVLSLRNEAPTSAFYGQVAIDPIGIVFKLLFVGVTTVAVLTSLLSAELPAKNMGEYLSLL